MNKIKEIVLSWAAVINHTEEQKVVAEHRLKTCMGNEDENIPRCENWKDSGIEHCGLCGCATKAKVFSPVGASACPAGKWTV